MIITSKQALVTRGYLWAAIGLFCALFAFTYPYYRYFVDPDAVAYLTMAKRAAAGEPWRLVNALWSPLHPALVALFIGAGLNDLLAAQLTNGLACVLVITATYKLFRRFELAGFAGAALLMALSVFLVYALYKQLFCDLWQVAILLFYLLLITTKNFLRKPWKWLLCAALMALATYAKVYSFYFLLPHFPLALWLMKRRPGRARFPLRLYSFVLLLQLMFLMPLLLLQHHKYGGWALSKSGTLNTSWMLTGGKTLRSDIGALIPPPYANSPCTWEDPWLAEGRSHSRFESLAMIKTSLFHFKEEVWQGVVVSVKLSPVLLIIFIVSLHIIFLRRGMPVAGSNFMILLAAVFILPSGYLLQHFEPRYIWLLVPSGMIAGERIARFYGRRIVDKRRYKLMMLLFAMSFVLYPLYDLRKMFRAGQDVFEEANALKAAGLSGSFTSNDNPSRSAVLAYWLAERYYTPAALDQAAAPVLKDMRRYGVKYYLSYPKSFSASEPLRRDEQGRLFEEVSAAKGLNFQVFLVNP